MKIIIIMVGLLVSQLGYSQEWKSLVNGVNGSLSAMYADETNKILYLSGESWSSRAVYAQTSYYKDGVYTYPNITQEGRLIGMYQGVAVLNYVYGNNPTGGGTIKTFDGTDTASFGTLTGVVSGAIEYNGSFYLAGSFHSTPSSFSPSYEVSTTIQKHNGSNWVDVTPIILNDSAVKYVVFCEYKDELYCGIKFSGIQSPKTQIPYLYKYNGTSWEGIAATNTQTLNSYAGVSKLEVYDDKLFMVYNENNSATSELYSWDGTSLVDIAPPIIGRINALFADSGTLYIGGDFKKSNGSVSNRITAYDGTAYSDMDDGFLLWVNDISMFDGKLYAVGSMDGGIAFWSDTTSGNGSPSTSIDADISGHNIVSYNVYPNPSSGMITLSLDGLYRNVTVVIKNILGQTLSTQHFAELSKEEFKIGDVAGVYFLEVYSENILVAQERIVLK